jgi:hypothetical protein
MIANLGRLCNNGSMKAATTAMLVALDLGLTVTCAAQAPAFAESVTVTFQLNDAFVKDKQLAGVRISIAQAPGEEIFISGETDTDGRYITALAPGTYAVSYALAGYVPIGDSETVIHSAGQVVTTTLSMMLEAKGGAAARRIRIILNWGSDSSQVKDADSHLICPCESPPPHVYYLDQVHTGDQHSAELDVDDIDWGGPETITISDSLPGGYQYWVHNYSGPPARLGESDVVVRVLFDDTVAAELKVPAEADREWRPFAEIVVGDDLQPRIVPFAAEELAAGGERRAPAGFESPEAEPANPFFRLGILIFVVTHLFVAIAIIRRFRRRRRSA